MPSDALMGALVPLPSKSDTQKSSVAIGPVLSSRFQNLLKNTTLGREQCQVVNPSKFEKTDFQSFAQKGSQFFIDFFLFGV